MIAPLSFPEFRPHPLLRGGHRQTLAGAFWPRGRIVYQAVQHQIALPDGDQVVLHDDCPADWKSGGRCVLLVHGLGGDHGSPYMVRLVTKLKARGRRVFRLDMRGCGAGYRLAQRPGHAGRSEDVAAALQAISRQCDASPVTAVGFSLGGNLVLKWAGECGGGPAGNLDSVMAVAPPIDLFACSQNISRPANRLYDSSFVRSLLRQMRQRREFVPALHSISWQPAPRTLFEFDDRVTAILSGFSGADEYYRLASSAPLLARITLPTLILAAADDPLIPVAMFRTTRLSSTIQLHVTRHGGHVGFVGIRGIDLDRHWMDWRVIDWINSIDSSSENGGEEVSRSVR